MTGPAHVLMTADAVGGVWTYALDLARGLAEAGRRTTLAVLGPRPTAEQTAEAWRIPSLDLVVTELPLDWTAEDPAGVAEASHRLAELSQGLRPDIVHLNSPALAAEGRFGAPVVGVCHSCLATWWASVKDGPPPRGFLWRAAATWRGMLACDALIAPSRSFAEATARAYDAPLPFVVHNGRSPVPSPAIPKAPLVFTAGRLWDEGKNIAVLDAAAAGLEQPVYAAGPLVSPQGDVSAQLAHARALGPLSSSAVAGWLGRAAVFASSARYEPFGLGVLEAAQAGCALVLSDIPTFRELWDGVAIFAPADDPDAFATAIRSLMEDPQELSLRAAAARDRAERYGVAGMTAGVLAVHDEVAARFAAHPARGAAA